MLSERAEKKLFLSLSPLCLLALVIGCPMQSNASFLGYYSLDNFTFDNSVDPAATATSPDGGSTLILTGPNNGSDTPGQVTFTIPAPLAGTVSFDYSYSSLDSPGFDSAGYLAGGTPTQLADTDGQSGSVQFQVSAGETFGFYVATVDNLGEPGVLTVTNFDAPGGVSAVPEPAPAYLALLAGAIGIAIRRFRSPLTSRGSR